MDLSWSRTAQHLLGLYGLIHDFVQATLVHSATSWTYECAPIDVGRLRPSHDTN